MLEVRGMSKSFGGVKALDDVSFIIGKGSIVGVIGPNGAGKTTLLNVISGIIQADKGDILLDGRSINKLAPHERFMLGISRTFQVPRIFKRITVLENMLVPVRRGHGVKVGVERAIELLRQVGLVDFIYRPADELSGGQQKLLEIARALINEPRLLLLDEPLAGVHPTMRQKVITHLLEERRSGTTMLIVSHDIPSIMELCDRVIVLSSGRKIAEDKPEEIAMNKEVIEAYLGV